MNILERLTTVYAPFCCLVCGVEGAPICKNCWPELIEPHPSTCYKCGTLTVDFAVCATCGSRSALTHVWRAAEYESTVKELIRGLKYNRQRANVRYLARLLDETLPYFAEPPLVAAIPTTTRRRRQRGYDQAVLIARELARLRHWPTRPLLRRLDQSHQVGSGRQERLAHEIEFRVTSDVRGRTILLVDDVITTGHTAESAALTLRKAGAVHVNTAIVAASPIPSQE